MLAAMGFLIGRQFMYLNIDLLLFFSRITSNRASDHQSGRPISNRTVQLAIRGTAIEKTEQQC